MNPENLRHLVDQRLQQIHADADRRHYLARGLRQTPANTLPRPSRPVPAAGRTALNT